MHCAQWPCVYMHVEGGALDACGPELLSGDGVWQFLREDLVPVNILHQLRVLLVHLVHDQVRHLKQIKYRVMIEGIL